MAASGDLIGTRFHPRSEGGFVIERRQDVEPILDVNKAHQNAPKQRGDFRKVASIPNIVIELWSNQSGLNILQLPGPAFAAFVRKKLADPDWRWLRSA